METDGSLELYTEKEIAPAVETFSTQLDSYLVPLPGRFVRI